MYDFSRRVECKDITACEVIKILKRLPKDAKILFNGDNWGYLHVEQDSSAISFDDSSLDEEY